MPFDSAKRHISALEHGIRENAKMLVFYIVIEKSFLIKISTNVSHRDYPLSTKTWLTFVIMMLTVQTPKGLIIVHVWRGTQGMEKIAMVCL